MPEIRIKRQMLNRAHYCNVKKSSVIDIYFKTPACILIKDETNDQGVFEMDMIQVGLGDFGLSWLRDVIIPCEAVRIIGLVDANPDRLRIGKELAGLSDTQLFTTIQDALAAARPQFILNATPPDKHKLIDLEAMNRHIAVLSEKPIAEQYEDALELLKKSEEMNVPIMISENYRFFDIVRKAKSLILSGEIGPINAVSVDFFRNHHMINYHKDLIHPLLLDVSIHHFDTLRYLTGAEVLEVFAKTWNPAWSWYKGYTNMDVLLEMDNDIKVSYRGSLVSPTNSTGWLADWMIRGSRGILKMNDQELRVCTPEKNETIPFTGEEDSRKKVLMEFVNTLKENRSGETDLKDNFETFKIVEAAKRSIMSSQAYHMKDLEV